MEIKNPATLHEAGYEKSAKHTSSDPLQQRFSHHHAACAALLFAMDDFVFILSI